MNKSRQIVRQTQNIWNNHPFLWIHCWQHWPFSRAFPYGVCWVDSALGAAAVAQWPQSCVASCGTLLTSSARLQGHPPKWHFSALKCVYLAPTLPFLLHLRGCVRECVNACRPGRASLSPSHTLSCLPNHDPRYRLITPANETMHRYSLVGQS